MEPTTTPEAKPQSKTSMGIPQAIIVAAVIIGVALVIAFGGKGGAPTAVKSDTDTVTPTGEISFNPSDPNEHVLGSRDADVYLIEYSDIDCPFCRRFHPVLHEALSDYNGKVSWVYREFPLGSLHPDAPEKALAVECAAKLGGNDVFWKYLDTLFTTDVSVAQLSTVAAQTGIDKTAFETCYSDPATQKLVDEDVASGRALGATGTPYTIVFSPKTGKSDVIQGAAEIEQVKQIIDGVLAK